MEFLKQTSAPPKPSSCCTPTTNACKMCTPLGACLAFRGIEGCVPFLHGSQGCTAFGKVFFVRHFREPIPLQTTAMDDLRDAPAKGYASAVAIADQVQTGKLAA